MLRKLFALVSVGVVAALGATIVAPPGAAQAYTSLQECLKNPAMLVLCREAMGLALPPAGVAGVISGQSVATGATSAVVASSSAPSWATGFSAVVSATGAALATIGGFLFQNGVAESRIETDPAYVPVEEGFADRVTVCAPAGECAELKFSGQTYMGSYVLCQVGPAPIVGALDLAYSLNGGSTWTGIVLGLTSTAVERCATTWTAEGSPSGMKATLVPAAVWNAYVAETDTHWRGRAGYGNPWG